MQGESRDGVPLSSVAPGWSDAADLDTVFEDKLAQMSANDFDALILRTRPPQEPTDPKERAAAALRRQLGNESGGTATKDEAAAALRRELGVNRRGTATKEDAAEALRRYATGH